jgi:hypothetical protein
MSGRSGPAGDAIACARPSPSKITLSNGTTDTWPRARYQTTKIASPANTWLQHTLAIRFVLCVHTEPGDDQGFLRWRFNHAGFRPV